jgi:UDP-N-acetylglucosamine--N-acetylmuramyl-(pentapeptide) pyrophosphoryl-undecaprenol N-acetylglucosamine transferase
MSDDSRPLVLMMAGGTGGHIYPALAVARELQQRGYRTEWLGTARGLEERVVPAAGIELHHLSVRGVRGKNLLHKILGGAALLLASLQALWLVLRLAPRCVVGMGGYASGPGGAAAWLLRKPLLVQEQNAVAGTTNRLLAPLARKVVAGFPAAFKGDVEFEVLGNPVRADLIEAAQGAVYDYSGDRPLRLLVLGGSLGAKPLNDLLPKALAKLDAGALEVWHQTGEAHVEDVRGIYSAQPELKVKLGAFIEDMAEAYLWADLVFCRAGALTVSELAVMGRPSLLVPLPHAIDDHQTANARYLADAGGARLLVQAQLDEESLATLLNHLLQSPAELKEMANAASGAALPRAASEVADRCEELIHGY